MRIGIAGANGAGKGEVVAALERRGCSAASLSDAIRADLARDGLEPTREHMIDRGRELREQFGPGILAERVLGLLPEGSHHVIDSIRHPDEARALREAGDFVLIWVEADIDTRYARSVERGRPGDGGSFEEFARLESLELASESSAGQQLLAVRELADEVLRNEGDRAELDRAVEQLLGARVAASPV